MRLRYHYAAIIVTIICSTVFLFAKKPGEYDKARELIVFRQIGHEVLLSVKDSTSKVLSVTKPSESGYRIEFEKPFALMPNSLLKIVKRILVRNAIKGDYVVSVIDPIYANSVYGFAVSPGKDNIVPCLGRKLPEKKYLIDIIFKPEPKPLIGQNSYPFIALLLVLGISGSAYIGRNKQIAHTGIPDVDGFLSIGGYAFSPEKMILVHTNETIALTHKENKLLLIFLEEANQVIDRSRLLKEGWEDDGVITQRSLDMYVSRLRKKLAKDPQVRISNIHGKGYRLDC